jgi:plastocyanin
LRLEWASRVDTRALNFRQLPTATSNGLDYLQRLTVTNRSALLLLTALTLAGCKHPAAPTQQDASAPIAAHPAPAVDPATAGSISGTVTFSGKAPARIPIDMSMDPACALATEPNLTEQYIVTDHKLANVYVYIKSGAPDSTAPAGTPPVVLDQKGCRYVPHVIAVQQGGTVEFRNSDPTMHNVHTIPTQVGNQTVDISETPMGAPQTEKFSAPEPMLPVRCNNHPWMQAFINVAPNRYFAVTGTDGSFTLPNLPPGTYTLAAIHEKLGEQDIQITVPAKSVAKASFTFASKE